MDSYLGKYSGIRQGKRYNKVLVTVIGIIAVLLVIVMTVGIIAGSDSERSQEISSAIEENTELKQLVAEQQEQIDSLSAELEEIKEKIPAEVWESYENVTDDTESSPYPASPRSELD